MSPAELRAIGQLIESFRNPVIVELGAHLGEDGKVFESLVAPSEKLRHIMVEPDPANAEVIGKRMALPSRHERILVIAAIADRSGEREFNFSWEPGDIRGSGSLLKPTGHLARIPRVKFPRSGKVPCLSLDQLCRDEKLTSIDLLWVDIQGAEREMIKGGRNGLAMSRYCFMEAEAVELYEGQALKPELISLMEGWEVIEEFEFNILLRNLSYRGV